MNEWETAIPGATFEKYAYDNKLMMSRRTQVHAQECRAILKY